MAKLKVGIVTKGKYIEYSEGMYESMVAGAVEEKVLPNPATVSDQVRYIQNANAKLVGEDFRFVWRLDYGS